MALSQVCLAALFLGTWTGAHGFSRGTLKFRKKSDNGWSRSWLRSLASAEKMAQETLNQMDDMEKASLLRGIFSYYPGFYVGNTAANERLGVPALRLADASQGFRPTDMDNMGTTTSFPCLLALAATWDESLVRQMGSAIAEEFRGKGANVLLGPGVNVIRVAAGGRNFEYLSGEDPYLGSRLVHPFVQAVQSEGIMATLKHFAFNEQETSRQLSSSNVDDRTAWNLYYPPFEAAIAAGAGAVMCAYNEVNGTHACESPDLLHRDLKGKMGFPGFVMSDWGAVSSIDAFDSGTDQEMPGGIGDSQMIFSDDALFEGSEARINDACKRILTSIYRVGLDLDECHVDCGVLLSNNVRNEWHAQVARDVATSSVVLLKNDGVLPLRDARRYRTVGVVGAAASAAGNLAVEEGDYYSGGGSGKVPSTETVTALRGFQEAAARLGITITQPTTDEEIKQTDVLIAVGAATSKETKDRESLSLDDGIDSLIMRVATLRPTVVAMMTPGAVLTPWRDRVSAIVNLFLGGDQSGNALADVVFGERMPAGKLPIMLPATEVDALWPSVDELNVEYREGLFTSYRSNFKAAFPFGHGLSYTNFSYGTPSSSSSCGELRCIELNITNTGSNPGTEIAQAYLEFPSLSNYPARVLRGFVKTKVVQPTESTLVQFAFKERDLSTYEPSSGWVLHKDAKVHIGSSSADIRHTISFA